MRRLLPRRSRLAAGLALVALLSAACVRPNKPGLAIKSLQSNIVFGINPPATPAGPSTGYGDLAPNELPALAGRAFPAIPPTPALPCPEATRSAVAQGVATANVTATPKAGTYRWKQTGIVKLYGVPIPVPLVFLNRRVENVSAVSESKLPAGGASPTDPLVTRTFTYDVRSELSVQGVNQGYEVDSYQVKDNPVAVNVLAPINSIPTLGGGIGKSVIVGDPERGVTLKKKVVYNPQGTVVGTFEPTPGLLLLPLVANSGEQYQTVGVDASTGAVSVLDVTVGARRLIDACGKLVQGWSVSAREYFVGVNQNSPTDSAAQTSQYDYVIATQLGGMLVYEKVSPAAGDVPVPAPPVVPGLPPLPVDVGPVPPPLPPLPVPLPTQQNTVELTIAQPTPTN